jgi:hypothetical protein
MFLDDTQLNKQTNKQTHTHTHAQAVEVLYTSDQFVSVAATYATHNKQEKRISMPSAGFESAIQALKRL